MTDDYAGGMRQEEANSWVPFDSYVADPEHELLVKLNLAIPLGDPQPMPEDVSERLDYDAWTSLWRRRHPSKETSRLG